MQNLRATLRMLTIAQCVIAFSCSSDSTKARDVRPTASGGDTGGRGDADGSGYVPPEPGFEQVQDLGICQVTRRRHNFPNIGPGGYASARLDPAQPFDVPGSLAFHNVRLFIKSQASTGGAIAIELRDDDGNAPGALMRSVTLLGPELPDVGVTDNGIYLHVDFGAPRALGPGRYWLTLRQAEPLDLRADFQWYWDEPQGGDGPLGIKTASSGDAVRFEFAINCGELPVLDLDGDGFATSEDCDDSEASISPSALEASMALCANGVDDDCDGLTDLNDSDCGECTQDSHCHDRNPCTQDQCVALHCQYTAAAPDVTCDDDNSCTFDDHCSGTLCTGTADDDDNDQYYDTACGGDDCDDLDPEVHPGQLEGPAGDALCSDGLDNDCSGHSDSIDAGCAPTTCSTDGWCLVYPKPTAHALNAVFRVAPNDVWAVGVAGTILHWLGTHWAIVDSGVDVELNAIWGAAADDIWVVGESGLALHWEGTTWTPEASTATENLTAISGFAADDIWAVGGSGAIIHWNGIAWVSVVDAVRGVLQHLTTVAAVAPQEAWAGGWSETLFHITDTTVADHTGVLSMTVASMAIDSAGALLAAGDGGAWRLGAGTAWSDTAVAQSNLNNSRLWRHGSILLMYSGSRIFSWDSASWTEIPIVREAYGRSGADYTQPTAEPMWFPSSTGNLYVGGPDGFLRWTSAGPNAGLWVTNSAMWSNDGSMYRWDGFRWINHSPSVRGQHFWGASDNDIYAVRAYSNVGVVSHFDGSAWTETLSTPRAFRSLHGSGASDVWAVGTIISGADDGKYVIADLDGSGGDMLLVDRQLNAIWVSASNNIWAVGDGFAHWNGNVWTESELTGSGFMRAIWGINDKLWAVGGNTVLHFDGSQWVIDRDDLPSGTGLTSIWGTAEDAIWAGGAGGQLWFFNGTRWNAQESGIDTNIETIHGTSGDNLWIQSEGTLLQHAPQ